MEGYDSCVEDVTPTRSLAVRLIQAAEQLKADFATSIAPSGLSVPAARALLMLDEPLPMRTLSDRLACNQSYITRIADELESQGLVKREPGKDRRMQILTLTPSGDRTRAAVLSAALTGDRVQQRLSAADQKALGRLLGRLSGD